MRKASHIVFAVTVISGLYIFIRMAIPYVGNPSYFYMCICYIAVLVGISIVRILLMHTNHYLSAGILTTICLIPLAVEGIYLAAIYGFLYQNVFLGILFAILEPYLYIGIICGVLTYKAKPLPTYPLDYSYKEKLRFEGINKTNPSAWAESQIKIYEERINARKKEINKCLEEIEKDYNKGKLKEPEYHFYKDSYTRELDYEKQILA